VVFIKKGKKMLNKSVSSLDLQKTKEITLLEVLDKALNKGVIIGGDLVISVADVDLLYVGIKILLSSVETMESLRKKELV
jgi:hypothetical protein